MSRVLSTRAVRSSPEALAYARARRERNADAKACVNHNARPATHGCRCADCYWRHRMGLAPAVWIRALELQRELARIARA